MLVAVLMLEDNPGDQVLADIAYSKLKSPQMEVELQMASTSQQARQIVTEKVPDLLFVDLHLEGSDMTGLEFIQWFRQNINTTTPLVAISSSKAPDDIRQAYACGSNSYLNKPTGFTELMATLEIAVMYWGGLNVRVA